MDPLAPLLKTLHADGRPRIWSLVITVFGDAVQLRGGRVATARLTRLLARIGVEGGAVRTALSRLSQDGWVEGRKEGRTSSYALTRRGVAAFGPASARIYAPPRDTKLTRWVFSTRDPGFAALRVAGGWIWPGTLASAEPGFAIAGEIGPHSAREVWNALDPEHSRARARLAADLAALQAPLDEPLDALAARILLIHRWRRLVLKWPEVPVDLVPADITPRDLHGAVAAAYLRLTPQAERWLDNAERDMPAMPRLAPDLGNRFKTQDTP